MAETQIPGVTGLVPDAAVVTVVADVATDVAVLFPVATRFTLLRPETSLHLTVEVMSAKEVQAVNLEFLVTKAT